VKTELGITEPI